ncbi:hypothetical protein BSLG_004540 [Batrachochytrium salamandrivorans]|nr:hypothetical protein BSLG_004540 [Batrachochytrium salamandrivorans]
MSTGVCTRSISKLVQASKILNIPLIVTEHVPKTFGSTVPELDISTAFCCLPKTKFSMWTDERLRKAGATITSSESILFEMLVDSTHADFKAISGLVKTTKGTTTAALEVLAKSLTTGPTNCNILLEVISKY